MNRTQLKMIFSFEMIKGIVNILFKYLPVYFYVRYFCRKEQCWLITERPIDARDNGYVLFKWLCENHPEIKIVYAIHKKVADYDNVKDLGKIIEYGSYKHWYYYFASTICCGTTGGICVPDNMAYLIMRNILSPRCKRVYLKHGIIKDYMPHARKHKLKADLLVSGAYPEWKYISENFGYENEEVKYIGLARYDLLINNASKNQILFMPTWRSELVDVDDFTNTHYYKTIVSLLKSKELNDILSSTNTDFIYFIHPTIRDKKSYFENFNNEHIRILNNEDYDMQKLICSSKLLITDFSSIYFDFAYQGKPVLYYHFDYDYYRKSHYKEGYFRYEKDGFGPIVKNEKELIENIGNIIENNWNVSAEFHGRANRFFPIRDKNNCQRHYDELCKLENIHN